jgi:hypothetical protein
MHYGDQIQIALRDRLESARDRCQVTAAAFHEVFSFVPADVSLAHHVKRIETAKNQHAAALNEFNLALRQWNEYVISGVVPDQVAPVRERRGRKRETVFPQFALSTR